MTQHQIEAMKLALEALEAMNPYPASKEEQRNTAITALEEALAQPEQETPKGWKPEIWKSVTQRKPLTDEVISALWFWSQSSQAEATANTQQHAFARSIEAAHGIKE